MAIAAAVGAATVQPAARSRPAWTRARRGLVMNARNSPVRTVLLLAVSLLVPVTGRAASVQCIPSVTGPVPITTDSQPFRALGLPPLAPGYVEQEFFLSCTAFGASYRTLLHVRRPAESGQFSGNVVLDTTHPLGLWPLMAVTA